MINNKFNDDPKEDYDHVTPEFRAKYPKSGRTQSKVPFV
jgi:hypothetical protein